jgi:hypothetical protein
MSGETVAKPVAGRSDARSLRFTFVTHHDGVSSALDPAPAILVRGGGVSVTDGPFAETKEQLADLRDACSGAASPSR